ncbi:MAG TPA: glycosyltransferase family 2 protein [Bacteroidia bacterium]|nr:glycosyltransferase family 2 protein [Bacteroidia bacterium]
MQPRVAVVILNFNTRKWLEAFLPSVLQTQYGNLEIVVADNNSTDDSVRFVEEFYPSVSIITLPKNYGFAGGYNECLKQVTADYFVLLNSDVQVTPNWVQPVIDLMETDTAIAACQPKILSWHDKAKFEYAGASGGYIDGMAYPFCRGRIIDHLETDNSQYNSVEEVFWASGAAMFIRAANYREAGGLDADFFAHMEEIDLCWRLKNRGYKIMAQPASVVYHVGGGTLSRQNPRKTFLNFHNCIAMMVKNMPGNELWWKLPLRFIMDDMAAVMFLFYGNWRDMLAVFRAHTLFSLQAGKWFKRRRELKKYRSNPNKTGIYKKSIVLGFFLSKKKEFSRLDF